MYSFPTDLQTRTERLLSEKFLAEKFDPGHCFFDWRYLKTPAENISAGA